MTSAETPRAAASPLIERLVSGLLLLPRRVLLGLITVYQHTLSPVLPAVFGPACGCRFYPTCSRYSAEAIRSHGALRGTWLTVVRLLKCTPLHPGGVDPVPPRDATARRPSCTRVTA